MKIAAIIAEYNPFHAGHRYHVEQTRKATGCDFVVAIMDGHFTQRGEAAFASKWDRARAALLSGVDAVFELPALFAVRTADTFARGGAAIADMLGADFLSFGSETPLETLRKICRLRLDEPSEVAEKIQLYLKEGMSHARARGTAYADYLGLSEESLSLPNSILGVEYLCALQERYSAVAPIVIPRVGAYHGSDEGFASASAVRAKHLAGENASLLLPEEARFQLENAGNHTADAAWLYILRSLSEEALSRLPDAGEGLDRLLLRCCREAGSVAELIDAMSSRRYTRARLSRLVAHAALGFSKALCENTKEPSYLRLLGARKEARPLLRELDARAKSPIVSSATALKDDPVFQLEQRATDLWALAEKDPERRRAGREFTEKFVSV